MSTPLYNHTFSDKIFTPTATTALAPPSPSRRVALTLSYSTHNETNEQTNNTASLININVALELTDAGSELAALILSVVGAALAAAFGSVMFHNQVRSRCRAVAVTLLPAALFWSAPPVVCLPWSWVSCAVRVLLVLCFVRLVAVFLSHRHRDSNSTAVPLGERKIYILPFGEGQLGRLTTAAVFWLNEGHGRCQG